MNAQIHGSEGKVKISASKPVTRKRLKEDAQALSFLIECGNMEEAAAFGAANPHVFTERMCRTANKYTMYVGEPFLNLAAERRSMACVESFLAAGAPIEGRGPSGKTALLVALKHSNVLTGGDENYLLVMALLDAGARSDALDDTGESPIYQCCGDLSPEITARLLQAPHTLDTWNVEHDIPSISLLVSRCHSSGSKERRASAVQLIEAGVDLNPRARAIHQLPLAQALYANDLDLAEMMIAHGADWRRCAQDGRSLMFSAMTPEAVQWVLNKDPSLRDATDRRGITPLQHMVEVAMTASFHRTANSAIMALSLAGADPTAVDNEGVLARTSADRITQGDNVELKSAWRSLLAGIEASRALDEINGTTASPATP